MGIAIGERLKLEIEALNLIQDIRKIEDYIEPLTRKLHRYRDRLAVIRFIVGEK